MVGKKSSSFKIRGQLTMRKVETDLSKLDELIARQYEDKIRGFAKDSLQNSWEARVNRKKGTNFKIIYHFHKKLDSAKNVLMLEDFGTTGMNDERWKAFHSHWMSTKGASYEGGVGRWGQGKTLLLYFSSTNTIITESLDYKTNKYKYSVRNNVEYWEAGDELSSDDPSFFKNKKGYLKSISDFFPSVKPLDHNGTRIWILNIKDDLASEIESGYLTSHLSESWWEIIRNYNIELFVTVNGHTQKVTLPQFPDTLDIDDRKILSFNKDHGKIKRLKIILAKSPIQPSLRGIAIQRGGMTVLRYPLPTSTPDNLRDRCYGYCQLDEKLDEEMWAIELANHESFESRKAVWVKLRRRIDSIAEAFILKHSKQKKDEPIPIKLDELIKTINKLVGEHLEGLGKGGGGNGGGNEEPHTPQPICISPWGYMGDEKRFDKDDIIQPKGAVRNRTKSDVEVGFKVWIESKSGASYWNFNVARIKVQNNSKVELSLPDVELSKISLKKGVYFLKADITDKKKRVIHNRSAVFYYEQDPPILGGWLKKLLLTRIGGPKANHRNLPINNKGELVVNTGYPEIANIYFSQSLPKKEKGKLVGPIIINCALHEAAKEALINWWESENNFDIEQLKRSKEIFDEMWADYTRETA